MPFKKKDSVLMPVHVGNDDYTLTIKRARETYDGKRERPGITVHVEASKEAVVAMASQQFPLDHLVSSTFGGSWAMYGVVYSDPMVLKFNNIGDAPMDDIEWENISLLGVI